MSFEIKESIVEAVESDDDDSSSHSRTCASNIWNDLMAQHNREREELQDYLKQKKIKHGEIPLEKLPVIDYLNGTVFPMVCQGLVSVLEKVREENSCFHQKSSFNGLDYLSEYLYNMNPRYPERQQNWTYIFDLDWVTEALIKSPRPYFPFSMIWTEEYAVVKIQSYMRGHWVRSRPDVQEVRGFWRAYKTGIMPTDQAESKRNSSSKKKRTSV